MIIAETWLLELHIYPSNSGLVIPISSVVLQFSLAT